MHRTRSGCFFAALALFFLCSPSLAQEGTYDVKANYDKTEVMIPMRDGVKLFTIIY